MNITEIITMVTPAAVSLFGIIAAVIKMLKGFRSTVEEIKSDTDIKAVKDEIKVLLDQNYELQNEIKELTEEITKIKKRG